jgi:hypothetical protein
MYHGMVTVFLYIKTTFGEVMIESFFQEWIWELKKLLKSKGSQAMLLSDNGIFLKWTIMIVSIYLKLLKTSKIIIELKSIPFTKVSSLKTI